MAARVVFHPAAILEAGSARLWYRDRSPRAADAFVAELRAAFAKIRSAPERWPRHVLGTRHVVLQRFPYHVIYRIHPRQVWIVAVAHGSRRPTYWSGRRADST